MQFRKMPPNDRRGRGNARSDKMTPTDPLTPQQTAVAKWLRHNVPTKKTKFMHSHTVEFFVGSKAVDMLMEDSPFSEKKVKLHICFGAKSCLNSLISWREQWRIEISS